MLTSIFRPGLFFLWFLLFLGISGCSGGGSDNGANTNNNNNNPQDSVINYPRPSANAGDEQYVFVDETTTLDGSASTSENANILNYHWSLLSKPETSTAIINNPNNIQATFIPDVAGSYKFKLIVNDGYNDSGPSLVTVFTQSSIDISVVVPAGIPVSELSVTADNITQSLDSLNSASFTVPDTSQIASLTDSTNEPIYLGLINPGSGEKSITLDATSTAIALIMIYPNVASALNTSFKDYPLYISTIGAFPETAAFAAVLQDQVTNYPNKWQDMDATFTSAFAAAVEKTLAAIEDGTIPSAIPPSEQVNSLPQPLSTSTQKTSSEKDSTSTSFLQALKYTNDDGITEIVNSVIETKSGLFFKLQRGYVNTRTGITNLDLYIDNKYQRYVYIVNPLDASQPALLFPSLDSDGFITTPFPSVNSDYIYGFGINEIADNPVSIKAIGPQLNLTAISNLSSQEKQLYYKASALTLATQVALPSLSLVSSRDCPNKATKLKIVKKVVENLANDAGFIALVDNGEWRKAGAIATLALITEYQLPSSQIQDEVKCVLGDGIRSVFRRLLKAIDFVDDAITATLIAKSIIDLKNSNALETWNIENTITEETPTKDIRISYSQSESNSLEYSVTIDCLMATVFCDEATIDFGDGTPVETKTLVDTITFTHLYAEPNEYIVTITVKDEDMAVFEKQITLGVLTCTQRGFQAEGVSQMTDDIYGYVWKANCVGNYLNDYPDSTSDNPHYALATLYGDGSDPTKLWGEISYTNGHENAASVSYSYYPSGSLEWEWPYINGVTPHGMVRMYYESGELYLETPYINGIAQGTSKQFWKNGNVQYETPFVDGLQHGTEKGYTETGVLNAEWPYIEGLLDGSVLLYYEDGVTVWIESPYIRILLADSSYQSLMVGEQKYYYSSGSLSSSFNYTAKLLPEGIYESFIEGIVKGYHENGQLAAETPYVVKVLQNGGYQSVEEGLARSYFEDGSIRSEIPYVTRLRSDGYYESLIEGIYKDTINVGTPQQAKIESPYVIKQYPDGSYVSVREGTVKYYYWSGALSSTVVYVVKTLDNGAYQSVQEGPVTGYYESGALLEEANYTAVLESSGIYASKTDGLQTRYYETGSKSSVIYYTLGVANGIWEEYYASGQISVSGQYTNGVRSGTWTWYNEDGTVNNTVTF